MPSALFPRSGFVRYLVYYRELQESSDFLS